MVAIGSMGDYEIKPDYKEALYELAKPAWLKTGDVRVLNQDQGKSALQVRSAGLMIRSGLTLNQKLLSFQQER